jgi:uncharacterized membrane protein YdbT with pleckstrin-like domain
MPDEQVLVVTRQHWSIVVPALLAITLAGAALLVADLLIPGRIGGVDFNRARAVAAIVIVLVTAVAAGIRYLRWRYTRYVLTNRRILMERGVLSRDSESIALDRIQNTIVHRPLGDRVLGAGDIEIESAGRDGTERLVRIPSCERFYATMLHAISGAASHPPSV